MGLVYEVSLPVLSGGSVQGRVVEISVDGVKTAKTLHISDTVTRFPPIKAGANVILTLKNLDNAGNETDNGDPVSFTANINNKEVISDIMGVTLVDSWGEVAPEPAPVPPPVVVEPEPEIPPVEEDPK